MDETADAVAAAVAAAITEEMLAMPAVEIADIAREAGVVPPDPDDGGGWQRVDEAVARQVAGMRQATPLHLLPAPPC